MVSLEANVKKFESELRRANQTTVTELDGVEKKFAKTSKSIGGDTANIAAQFQDIAVSLQGGQSPFTIALQQGTQISAVLGRQGAAGAVGLLSSAFSSIISPVSLATIGIIALGGMAVKWLTSASAEVKTLDDLIKEHESNLKDLTAAYGGLGKGIDVSSVKNSVGVAESLVRQSVRALQEEYKRLSNDAATSMSQVTAETTAMGDATGTIFETTGKKFAPFKDAIDAFRESARSGTPDVKALRDAVAEIERTNSDPKVKKLTEEILALTNPANDASTALQKIERTVGALGQAISGEIEQFKNFAAALGDLSKISLPKLDDRQKVTEAYTRAVENATGVEERRAAVSQRDAAFQRINDAERKKAAEDAAREAQRAADRSARKAASDQKSFENTQENVRKSTEMLQLEFDMIGKTAQERDRARITIELESAARKANQLEIAGTREKIDALATAYAAAAERARQANGPLASFARSAADSNRLLQEASVGGLRTLEDAFLGIISGSTSAQDAFKRMADAIIADLARIAIRQAITGPIAGALGGIFGGGGSSIGNSLGGSLAFGGARATGGPVTSGRAYMVGERGPELMVPGKSGMVIPNHALGRSSGGGGSITFAPQIDARGADVAAVARIEQVVARSQVEFESRVKAVVQRRNAGRW